MYCTRLAGNAGCKKIAKKSPTGHQGTTLSGYIFATKSYIGNRKKIVKQQYLLHMSAQYGELQLTNGYRNPVTLMGYTLGSAPCIPCPSVGTPWRVGSRVTEL